MANKKLALGLVGCFAVFGIGGLVCSGVGLGAYMVMNRGASATVDGLESEPPAVGVDGEPVEDVAAAPPKATGIKAEKSDFLVDAAFLGVDRGIWASPVAWPAETPSTPPVPDAPPAVETAPTDVAAPSDAAAPSAASSGGGSRPSSGGSSSGGSGRRSQPSEPTGDAPPPADEPQAAGNDDEPVISDEELRDLDAELVEIQRNHAAAEDDDKKKKKK